ncbi:TetR/AcrR family transcriptional regulator [Amycolatopsis sp. NPDC059021]|uniref:TetR/AcrR family transcriptional regulator n=1 Tax=Amycolatopsis sp. NPDC059021 TaxID=3346704 RepID=UPI003671ED3F
MDNSVLSRGSRPRNRRALIVAAAGDLFARRGYARVGMSEIAEAVAIGPSALYRHFSGKQDLLREVITEGLVPIRDTLSAPGLRGRAALRGLAAIGVEHRPLGVLWQREARHLADDDRARLRRELREIGALAAGHVRLARPGLDDGAAALLAWSVIAVAASVSFHRVDLSRVPAADLLAGLIDAVLDTGLPDPGERAPSPPAVGMLPASRREALLIEAVRMFAERGYTGVAIEDIGAAVGIAGPSVYNHFPAKLDVLTTACRRGIGLLYMDLTAAYTAASAAPDALRALIRSYTRFTRVHPDFVTLLISEIGHLPEEERHSVRRAQYDYVSEWVHLLGLTRRDIDPIAARIRVHAALSVPNDAARTPRLRRGRGTPAALERVAAGILGIA